MFLGDIYGRNYTRFSNSKYGMDTSKTLYSYRRNPTSNVGYIKFKAPSTNTGLIALGTVTVTMATGYELAAGQTLELTECGLQNLYIDAATNGDKIAWIAWSTESD